MRPTALLTLALLALALPGASLAGTFPVPFGNGTPMTTLGWTAKPDAGAVCGYEGVGTLYLNAGTLPAHSGCFYLFNAPGNAQIVSVNVSLAYTKASAATALCAYSFAAQPGDTLRRCSGGSSDNAIATSGANWVELGIYNEGAAGIALATARANNAVFGGGFVTLSDPTPPAVWANGPGGVQSGLSTEMAWSASDQESGSPSVSYAVDGGARIGVRGQACSWLCGTLVNGTATIDLSALADGPHTVTVYAKSYADAESSIGPFAFRVDRTAPAAPQVQVMPDAAAATAGWWGHAPIALTVSSTTAPDVVSSSVRVYGPTGALVQSETIAGAAGLVSLPAGAFTANGAYEAEIVECDVAGHCAASARAALRWDGSAPAVPADATAPPLGSAAARDGAHLTWPAAGAAAGASGVAGGFTGIGATPAAARAQALAATTWEAGVPGESDAVIPASAVRGAAQVCLAVRPLSGSGVASASAGVRCALVDELPPAVTLTGAQRWSGGAQTVGFAVSDASGATFTQVLLDGAPVVAPGSAVTIAGEGAHVLRAVARDGAGNETVVERPLGVDASAPAIGAVAIDFVAREIRVPVADPLSGIALAEVRLGSTALETRLSADGGAAIARVPAGLALDGAAVSVRVQDASSPVNIGARDVVLPERAQPLLTGMSVSGGLVTGRVVAPAGARVRVWAYPKGRLPVLAGTSAARAGGVFALRVRPDRTTRYAVAVLESQSLRGLGERSAGTLRVTARVTRVTVRAQRDRLVVRARFAGRGEATRLHLLVHDLRGGRWVEGCLERGRPGVHLERTGRVWGTCRIPPSARGRAWTYRLVLAAPSSTWPWRTPSSASVSVLLPL